MKTYRSDSKRLVIDTFSGLNEHDGGQMLLKPGESAYMRNFRVTAEGKLQKRGGWRRLIPAADSPILAMWKGRIGGEEYFLFVRGGCLYTLDTENETCTLIGSVSASERACLFYFAQCVYVLTDGDYLKFDGQTLTRVEGYIPVVCRNTAPSGEGEALEAVNLLTASRRQFFSPDGVSTEFWLWERALDRIDAVLINGEEAHDYMLNYSAGKVTFSQPPAEGIDSLEVRWTKGSAELASRRARITSMRRAEISGRGDSRIFLWGDAAAINRVMWSEQTETGPSAEYFTEEACCYVGSGEFAVTDILRQRDRNLIFTEKSAWMMTWSEQAEEGNTSWKDFPVSPLNDTKGAALLGEGRLLDNDPVTVTRDGVYRWTPAGVRDERNAKLISGRVGRSFKEHAEGPICTLDDEHRGEYWLCFSDGLCLVYNYQSDLWVAFDGIPACAALADGSKIYFATSDGSVCCMEDGLNTDDGQPFECCWEMRFEGFGKSERSKNLMRVYVALEPNSRADYTLTWHTNRDSQLAQGARTVGGSYAYFGYDLIDYGNFTYDTLYTPQIFRHRLLVKRFAFLKLILKHKSDYAACTVLSLTLEGYPTSETKE